MKILKEDVRLKSQTDKYFFFFRSDRDCFAYILQDDSTGTAEILFQGKGGDGRVKQGKDYWVPSFGNAYTLDNKTGEEKLYLIVSSWPLTSEIEGFSMKEQIRGAVRSLKTRRLEVVAPSNAPETLTEEKLKNRPQSIGTLLEKIKGEEGWVREVRFSHE